MPRPLARAIKWMVAISVGACLLFLAAAPPEWLFDAPLRREERTRARLQRYLSERSGLLYALTFDEPTPREFFTGRQILFSGTTAGPGRYGQARKFDGRERTQIETPLRWDKIGSAFTLAFWLKMPQGRADQYIWYRSAQDVQLGFHLEEGRMTFDLPTTEGRQCLAYPFERYGQFVHLAVTVDPQQGKMALYENGQRKAEAPILAEGMPSANMAFGKPMWYASRNPFHGSIDEVTVWKRVLAEKEVRRLARSKRSVLWAWGSNERYLKWQIARAWVRILRASAGVADLPAAMTRQGYREMQAIHRLPEVRLMVSGKVRRELVAAHQRSRKSGRRTQAGAHPRLIHVAIEGAVYPAWIRLAGSDLEYADGARAGYELDLLEGAQVLGARRLLLSPPEGGDWLFPLVDTRVRQRLGLPAVSNGLCRLRINGLPCGVYLFSNHEKNGLLPGDLPDICTGSVRHPRQWFLPFHHAIQKTWEVSSARMAWPLTARELEEAYDATLGEWGGCVRGDLQDPLSRREINWQLAQGRMRISALWPPAAEELPLAQKVAGFLDEFMVLGSNGSPDRLVAPLDLDLAPLRKLGVEIRWRSSDSAVLGPDGKIARPASGGPVGATLVATVDDGQANAEKTLAFRVMPQQIALPTLFLNVRDELDKTRRADAVVEVCNPGEDFPTRILYASQGSRGGIEHRGNSSYWNPKKLFSLKTDEPHRLWDESERRILLAVNSEQDPTFIRNALAYELFRSWGTEAAPRLAPETSYAEVFVNGRYHGLFELSARVDETLLDANVAPDEDFAGPRWIMYRHEAVYPRMPGMRARRPAPHEGEFEEPYRSLMQLVEQPSNPAWAGELSRKMDLPNLADFELLLNLFQNRNGYPFDFPMHEALVYDDAEKMFFHVPWDFESTPLLGQWEWLHNETMKRLEEEAPSYSALLATRWRGLRAKGLTPEAIDARIDEMAQPLKGYVEWDYKHWGYERNWGYGPRLENLKALMRESISQMDNRFGG